jgi:hypothetical protein
MSLPNQSLFHSADKICDLKTMEVSGKNVAEMSPSASAVTEELNGVVVYFKEIE